MDDHDLDSRIIRGILDETIAISKILQDRKKCQTWNADERRMNAGRILHQLRDLEGILMRRGLTPKSSVPYEP